MKTTAIIKQIVGLLLIAIVMVSCENKKPAKKDPYKKFYKEFYKESESKDKQIVNTPPKKQPNPYNTPAIGNLYLGVTLSEFEEQRDIFLSNVTQLAGLKIDTIIPLLYRDKVERIVVISEKHIYHEAFQTFKNKISTTAYWKNLYDEKYGKDNWEEMNGRYYSVNDGVIEPLPYTEFLFESTKEYEEATLQNIKTRNERRIINHYINCYEYETHSVIIITNKIAYDAALNARDEKSKDDLKKQHQYDLNVI